MKSFREFIAEQETYKKIEDESVDYSSMSVDKLIQEFNQQFLSERNIASTVGSALVTKFHSKIKREKNLDKKLNLLADMILVTMVSQASSKSGK